MKLDTDYQQFIAVSRYCRWLEEEKRRETPAEAVRRYITNVVHPVLNDYPEEVVELETSINNLGMMPSMRALMTAGPALTRDNTAGYNCAYLPVDDPKSFDEAMYILLCGTGVGFSVERQYISKLPTLPDTLYPSDTTVVVKDSKEGWAKALRQVIALLYAGEMPQWDTSRVRPAGARLKTFGGRASGPAPLIDLFNFVCAKFKAAEGRRLTSIECHDIMCKIGEVVVVGGVRRSAMISLSNLSDDRMRHAKSGMWWEQNQQRALSNNSVAYTEKPDMESFMREWTSLMESKSGERGMFNRAAAKRKVEESGRRDPEHDWGTNPCSEIILRPYQFCNLTEVVVRAEDTLDTLKEKVRLATILGTIQSTYTKFPYLRKIWQKNTEEERLLGVSLTGIMDHPILSGNVQPDGHPDDHYDEDDWYCVDKADWGDDPNLGAWPCGLNFTLKTLKQVAIDTNKEWSEKLGIPQSTAITCVKPSGTVSQLVDSASGIHPRHSPYYTRTVRGDNADPITQFMKDKGVPHEPDITNPSSTAVFGFPIQSPTNSAGSYTAISHLQLWLEYARHWCEHKPSVTISVKDDEWMEVGAFVYKHFDEMSGVSFLPHDGGTYQQAPYQECTKEEYEEMEALMPKDINWSELSAYETEDHTAGSQTFACSGDVCEVVDLV